MGYTHSAIEKWTSYNGGHTERDTIREGIGVEQTKWDPHIRSKTNMERDIYTVGYIWSGYRSGTVKARGTHGVGYNWVQRKIATSSTPDSTPVLEIMLEMAVATTGMELRGVFAASASGVEDCGWGRGGDERWNVDNDP